MIRKTWPLAAIVLAIGLPADAAQDPDKPAKQCFWTDSVSSFTAVDDRTVNVRVGVKEVYQLVLFSRCPDVDWSERIALRSRGTSSICTGLDAEIVVPSTFGPSQRCAVRTVRKLTPEEVAALPPKQKP